MRNHFLTLTLLALALSSRPALADPLEVTSGVFLLQIESDLFTLAGHGFNLATVYSGEIFSDKLFNRGGEPGTGFPPTSCFSCPEAEGEIVDWSFRTADGEQLLGKGSASIDGINATNVDFLGSMQFDVVPTPLLSGGTNDFEFVAPFVFQAMIRGVQNGQELFARQFTGRGFVSVGYEESGVVPGSFVADDEVIPYEFGGAPAPIPEPTTLLLFGSGLGAAVLRRRRA